MLAALELFYKSLIMAYSDNVWRKRQHGDRDANSTQDAGHHKCIRQAWQVWLGLQKYKWIV